MIKYVKCITDIQDLIKNKIYEVKDIQYKATPERIFTRYIVINEKNVLQNYGNILFQEIPEEELMNIYITKSKQIKNKTFEPNDSERQ